jgi:hypothetical protein
LSEREIEYDTKKMIAMEDIYIVPNFHSNIKYYLKDKFSWKGDRDAGGWAMSKTFI